MKVRGKDVEISSGHLLNMEWKTLVTFVVERTSSSMFWVVGNPHTQSSRGFRGGGLTVVNWQTVDREWDTMSENGRPVNSINQSSLTNFYIGGFHRNDRPRLFSDWSFEFYFLTPYSTDVLRNFSKLYKDPWILQNEYGYQCMERFRLDSSGIREWRPTKIRRHVAPWLLYYVSLLLFYRLYFGWNNH